MILPSSTLVFGTADKRTGSTELSRKKSNCSVKVPSLFKPPEVGMRLRKAANNAAGSSPPLKKAPFGSPWPQPSPSARSVRSSVCSFASRAGDETDVEEADIGLAEGGNRGIRGAQNVAGCCVILAGLNAYVGAVGKEDDGPAIAAIMIAEFLERARVGQSVVGFQIGGALLVTESINLLVQGTSVSGNIGPTTVLASLGVIA